MGDRQQDSGSEGREGFGDDGGTRVGRPDPARGADTGSGPSSRPVKEGLEGAIFDGEGRESDARESDARESDARESDAREATQRGQPTGAGAQAAEGTHDASRDRAPSDNTGADVAADQNADPDNARRGSEPLTGREKEHVSGYGGTMGEPRTSSDQRE